MTTKKKDEEFCSVFDGYDPIATYDKLADMFYAETGVWPPGRSLPLELGWDGISDDERWDRWMAWRDRWYAARNADRVDVEK